jgi:hypothetical protein
MPERKRCGITWFTDETEHRCAESAGHPDPCLCHCGAERFPCPLGDNTGDGKARAEGASNFTARAGGPI